MYLVFVKHLITESVTDHLTSCTAWGVHRPLFTIQVYGS